MMAARPAIKAVLFDFDGTLIHSDPAHLVAFNRVLARFGRSLTQADYDRQVAGRSNIAIFSDFFPDLDEAAARALGDEKERAYLALSDLVAPAPGAEAVLGTLRRRGIARALVTNAPRAVVDVVADRLGLLAMFDTIVTVDDVAVGKPDPAAYRLALTRLGIAPAEALVIEDSPAGLAAGEAAGIDGLYLGTPAPDRPHARAGTRPIAGLADIPDLIGA